MAHTVKMVEYYDDVVTLHNNETASAAEFGIHEAVMRKLAERNVRQTKQALPSPEAFILPCSSLSTEDRTRKSRDLSKAATVWLTWRLGSPSDAGPRWSKVIPR